MTHVAGTPSVAGARPRVVRARSAEPVAQRRPGAVFVRLPRVESGRTAAPLRRAPSREAMPDRRHAVEYDLRRVRRELKPPVRHSVRNTVILIVILLAAASLTVWVTQGIQEHDAPPGRLPATEADSLLTESDAITIDEAPSVSSQGLASWPRPREREGSVAPSLEAWPPAFADAETVSADSLPDFPDEPRDRLRRPLAREIVAAQQHGGDQEMVSELAMAPANSGDGDSAPTTAAAARAGLSRSLADPVSIGGGSERYEGPVASLLPIKPVGPVRR